MSRHVTAVIAVLAGFGIPAAEPPSSLDWIGGQWCAERGDEIVEEVWLPPHGGIALGLSRTRVGSETVAFEYLRIVDLAGIPSYVAQPGGRPPTTFKRTAGGETWIRFENPEHDFPQRIEYRREGETLHAEIAGPGEDETEMVISVDYRRCGS